MYKNKEWVNYPNTNEEMENHWTIFSKIGDILVNGDKKSKISESKNQKFPFLAQKRIKLTEFGNNSLNM